MNELPNDIKHLYMTWLDEEIVALSSRQHNMGIQYSRALDSLTNHPGQVKSPNDLKRVKYFGPKIILKLQKRLENYCKENGYISPTQSDPIVRKRLHTLDADHPISKKSQKASSSSNNTNSTTQTKKVTKKQYVPKRNSGGYAILLVLLEFDSDQNGMTKDAISTNASPYCTQSFISNPAANQLYSAWSSMKTLKNHDLVKESGRPSRYFLTTEGLELTQKLKQADNIKFRNEVEITTRDTAENHIPTQRYVVTPRDRQEFQYDNVSYHYWEPGTYEVVFIIDNREVRAVNQRDYFASKLEQYGVNVEVRVLTVGDGLWIARNKITNEEVVLDYIIERKRLDDLEASITDGRYNEQKVRLKRSAIDNIFYVVEEVTTASSNMATAIQTSMSLVMTATNFHLQRTKDADDSIQFIIRLHKQLQVFYSNKRLLVLTPKNLEHQDHYKQVLDKFKLKFTDENTKCVHQYSTFDSILSKSNMATIKEIFVKMLMTVRGISLTKAVSIQKEFKTPRLFIENFNGSDPEIGKRYGKKIQSDLEQLFQK